MSVSNGQTANQTTFNTAFGSKSANNTFTGVQDLNNAAASSGDRVTNVQREFSAIRSVLGMAVGQAFDYVFIWASDIVGAAGDTVKERVEALVDLFDGSAGHAHDGTDGEGPPLEATDAIASTGVTTYSTLKANTADGAIWVNDGPTIENQSRAIANGQAVAADVTGLAVNATTYKSALVRCSISRKTDSAHVKAVGWLALRYVSGAWVATPDEVLLGDALGVTFSVLDTAGVAQVQYTSDTLAGANYLGTIEFRGDLFT